MDNAYLLIGSNIQPEENIKKAIALIQAEMRIANISSVWESHAVGNNGPNFLNCVLVVETELSIEVIKNQVIRNLENSLGRVRTNDKYAPRTIDVDLIVYNGQMIDPEICHRVFIAVPLAELVPDFYCIDGGVTLKEAADTLKRKEFIRKWDL